MENEQYKTDKNLKQRINDTFKSGLRITAAVGMLYLGSLAMNYATIKGWQNEIERHKQETPKIEFSHVYNPLTFFEDNRELVERGQQLRKEHPRAGIDVEKLGYRVATGAN